MHTRTGVCMHLHLGKRGPWPDTHTLLLCFSSWDEKLRSQGIIPTWNACFFTHFYTTLLKQSFIVWDNTWSSCPTSKTIMEHGQRGVVRAKGWKKKALCQQRGDPEWEYPLWDWGPGFLWTGKGKECALSAGCLGECVTQLGLGPIRGWGDDS